jgi:hypothetical protein
VKFPENGPRDLNNKRNDTATLNLRCDKFSIEIILFEKHGGKSWHRQI